MRLLAQTGPTGLLPLRQVALFLDLDGTLAEIRARPEDVQPKLDRSALLERATQALGGRVAIISGRPMEDIDHILGRACLAVAGGHGLQRRSAAGEVEAIEDHPRIDFAAEILSEIARRCDGVCVEHKGESVALHYRGAPRAEAAILECVERLALAEALVIQREELAIELLTPGPDKGAAVTRYLTELPFKDHTPIYIGDALNDESAFKAVTAHGGLGVLVGSRRPTLATRSLATPAEVRAWISTAIEDGAFDLETLQWVD